MAAPRVLVDGRGKKNALKINGEGEISVVIHQHPPVDEEVTSYPFSQFFTNDGSATGSSDMRVNGSTTAQEFYIAAQQDRDIFIKTISVRIADQSAVLNKFGNLTALTSGIKWSFTTNVLGEITVKDEIKTNLDFIRLGLTTASIGDGASAFRADVSGSSADTYLPIIDLAQTFGFQWGLRLQKGTKDKVGFIVQDDLSVGMDGFDIFGFGSQL